MSENLLEFTAELLLLFQESADYCLARERPVLLQALALTRRIYRRISRIQSRYVIALVGLTNVGKSTLLNGLLGESLAPRRNGACTACPVEFKAGEPYRVTAMYSNDFRPHTQRAGSADAVRELLQEYVVSEKTASARRCTRVVVELEHPLLSDGLVLADTPGFGAAQFNDEEASHEESVCNYLKEDVAHIFWLVLAEHGIGQRERTFFETWLTEPFVDVVVTGSEDWSRNVQDRFERRYRTVFTEEIPPFHFVGHSRQLETRPLTDMIESLQSPQRRQASCREALWKLGGDVGEWLRRPERRQPAASFWRPDSLARFAHDHSAPGLRDELLKCWRDSP